ncbi:MAG: tRNA (guanosine(37)-N1)-methyltransferase TrmD [Solobacterium sp.]|nr:tRNA (guanosine(37)-N1)-methyltransferase TrmD [Solobacterium sp.]
MKISVLTMFPEMFDSFARSVLVERAAERDLLELEIIDIKDYAGGSYRHIDDSPFGGGAGMVIRCAPVIEALETIGNENSHTVMFAPSGTPYTQAKVHEFEKKEHIILICGHYEGIDARVNGYCDEFISMGDYVLSGGEIPAMAVIDSLVRLIGTIRRASTEEESFENGLLEYPQYTRPAEYRGMKVPEVLLSGNHGAIERWRMKESLKQTLKVRPDLIEQRLLTTEEKEILEEIENEKDEVQFK